MVGAVILSGTLFSHALDSRGGGGSLSDPGVPLLAGAADANTWFEQRTGAASPGTEAATGWNDGADQQSDASRAGLEPAILASTFHVTSPAGFVEHGPLGAAADVRFVARAGGVDYSVGASQLTAAMEGGPSGRTTVVMTFAGANTVQPEGQEPLPTSYSFLRGPDPSLWVVGARAYEDLTFTGIYDGIDLVLRWSPSGLKYEFVVGPHRDPGAIRVGVAGATGLQIEQTGDLSIFTRGGVMTDAAPTAFQGGLNVGCAYRILSNDAYGFACEAWDESLPLTIDPLLMASYLGGSELDIATCVAHGPGGQVYVAGYTRSTDFPTTSSAPNGTLAGLHDIFVSRLSSDGTSVEYSTFVGGEGAELPYSMEINSLGEVFVAGITNSTGFPTTSGAWHTSFPVNNSDDGFAFRLRSDGSGFVYSTYLGGTHGGVRGAFLATDDTLYVAGVARNESFPLGPVGIRTAINNNTTTGEEAFAARISASGDGLIFATFFGGGRRDDAGSIAVDGEGNVWLTGQTQSFDFPTTSGAFQRTRGPYSDAYAVKLNPTGQEVTYGSYIGGSQQSRGWDLALTPGGDPIIYGWTNAMDLATTPDSFQPAPGRSGFAGTADAFAIRLDGATGAVRYFTYLGGLLTDYPIGGIAVDQDSNAYLAGWTEDLNFPTTPDAIRPSTGAFNHEGFLVKLNAAGSRMAYGTLLGGSDFEHIWDIDVDAQGNVLVAMYSNSTDLPTTPGAVGSAPTGFDAYVARLSIPTPTLFIDTPANGTNTSLPAVWVAGLTDPGVNLSVSGVRVAVAENGSWGLVVALLPGANTIEALAVSPSGNTSQAAVVVTYIDPVPGLLAQISAQQAALNSTNALLDATRAEMANLTADLNMTGAQLAATLDLLNATRADLEVAEAGLSASIADLEAARSQLSALEAQLTNESAAANATGAELAAVRAQMQANLTLAFGQVAELEAALNQTRATANGTAVAYAQLAARLAQQEAGLNEAAAENAATRDALNETRQELDQARDDLAATRFVVWVLLVGLLALGAAMAWVAWRGRPPPRGP